MINIKYIILLYVIFIYMIISLIFNIIIKKINTLDCKVYENLDPNLNNSTDIILYKNSTIPIFIICYNQYTFVKSMVEQLLKYSTNIYIIDNKSTYPPLVEYLKSIENIVNVIYMPYNEGHWVYEKDEIIKLGGDKYIVTDPDLTLNPNLPQNFIDILAELSDQYQIDKIGFSLDISNNINTSIKMNGINVPDWEANFWKEKINNPKYELYKAPIDTTFCLINSKYYKVGSYEGIRVAGDFTCTHIPWTIGYEKTLLDGELDFYKQNNASTTWIDRG